MAARWLLKLALVSPVLPCQGCAQGSCAELPLTWDEWGAGGWGSRWRFRWCGGRRREAAPLSAAVGACQRQASPTGAAHAGTGPPVRSPRAVFGAELLLQGQEGQGSHGPCGFSLPVGKTEITPSSCVGFLGRNCLPTNGKLLITYTTRSQPSVSAHILTVRGLRSPLPMIM